MTFDQSWKQFPVTAQWNPVKSPRCSEKARGLVDDVVAKQQDVTRSHDADQPRSQGRDRTLGTRLHVGMVKFFLCVNDNNNNNNNKNNNKKGLFAL